MALSGITVADPDGGVLNLTIAQQTTNSLRSVLGATLGLRVSEEDESEGLDLASHGERGYSP